MLAKEIGGSIIGRILALWAVQYSAISMASRSSAPEKHWLPSLCCNRNICVSYHAKLCAHLDEDMGE